MKTPGGLKTVFLAASVTPLAWLGAGVLYRGEELNSRAALGAECIFLCLIVVGLLTGASAGHRHGGSQLESRPGRAWSPWLRPLAVGAFAAFALIALIAAVGQNLLHIPLLSNLPHVLGLAGLSYGSLYVLGWLISVLFRPSILRWIGLCASTTLLFLESFDPSGSGNPVFLLMPSSSIFVRLRLAALGITEGILEPAFVMAHLLVLSAGTALFFLSTKHPTKTSRLGRALPVLALVPTALFGSYLTYSNEGRHDREAWERQFARNRRLAFQDVRIVVGDGTSIESGTLLVEGGKIVAVYRGPASIDLHDATVIPGASRTVLPGLIDTLAFPAAYARRTAVDSGQADQMVWEFLQHSLIQGITCLRAGDLPDELAAGMRTRIGNGRKAGPQLCTAGTGVSKVFTEGSGFLGPLDSNRPPAADTLLLQIPNLVRKPFLAMLHVQARRAQADGTPILAVVESWSEVPEALELGAEGIVLSQPLFMPEPDTIELLKTSGTFLSPHTGGSLPDSATLRVLHTLHTAGVRMTPASQAGREGLHPDQAFHEELAYWVKSGIPATDVIRAATGESAGALGLANRIGTIVQGKDADLLLVEGNPLEDLSHLRRVVAIVVKGELISGTSAN